MASANRKLHESLPSISRFAGRFWPKLREQRRLIAGSLVMLLAEVFLRLLEPWPLSLLIDHVIVAPSGNAGRLGDAIRAIDPMLAISLGAAALVTFTGLRALARYVTDIGFALVGNRVTTEIRSELYRHLQNLSLSFHTRARGGDLVVRVIGDVGRMRDVLVTALLPLLGNFLILGGMLAVMLVMNWRLTLVALVAAPLYWLSTAPLARKIKDVSRKQRKREGVMASTASESIGAIQTVQALALNDAFASDFHRQNKKSMKESVKGKRLAARMERTVDVLNVLAQAVVLWFGARLVLRHELSAGELLVFLTYLKSAFRPVRNFAKYSSRIAKASAAGERVLDILERQPEVEEAPDAIDLDEPKGKLVFENVSFGYEPDQPVLRRISFEVSPGHKVALVGESGAGKSTIVGLCLRLFDPDEGQISIDGIDLRDLKLESLRTHIGVVLQDSPLFAASVRENIAFGSEAADPERVESAAKLAHADRFIRAMPDAYDSVVGERGVTLSRGQRQRISIARAAIRSAPILLLDEPITALDEENAREVTAALDRLAEGRTTLLVTHDLNQARRCDEILYLQGGEVCERGTHEALMALGGHYARATAPRRPEAPLLGEVADALAR